MNEEPEMLEVRFNSAEYFFSRRGLQIQLPHVYEAAELEYLDEQHQERMNRYLVLTKKIPKQISTRKVD